MTTIEAEEVTNHVRSVVTFTRRAKKMKLRELCKECGVSIPSISRIENGGSMDATTFIKLVEWMHNAKHAPSLKRGNK